MGRTTERGELLPSKEGKKNLLKVWHSSRTWEKAEGLLYYSTMRNRLVVQYSWYNLHDTAAIFCVLSPNNSEAGNWEDLHAMWCAPADQRHTIRIHTYNHNRDKAIALLAGAAPQEVIQGPKTRAFFHNIVNPWDMHHVTIDGHMVSAYQGKRLVMDQAAVTAKEYEQIAGAARKAAKEVGVLPSQFQSTVWMAWKRQHRILYKPQMKLGLGE